MPKAQKRQSQKGSRKKSSNKNGSNKKAKYDDGEGISRARVYVAHISHDVTKEKLGDFAGVEATRVILINHPNGSFKGIAFLDFNSKGAANSFVKKANGKDFLGQVLVVKHAEFRSRKGPAVEGPVSCFIGGVANADDDLLKGFAKGMDGVRWIENDGQFKGYGFVTFNSIKAADSFVQKNGKQFLGNSVRINYGTGYAPTAFVRCSGGVMNEDKLKRFVGNSGTIRLKNDGTYGFVDFQSLESYNAFCVKNGEQFENGKIMIKHAKKAQPSQITSCYVGRLPDGVSEKALKKFAGANVLGVHLPEGKDYGFVHFTDSKSATAFLSKNGNKLKGKEVTVAYPKFGSGDDSSGQGSL